ncbi:hypothetical protein ElyMa_001311100 [Elysia marginata]|uniref:Uncharacterized protein n=1 Tax=Elysia marginata TaxID=1093978 RepID=A0AAV4IJQ6_9GAST|nr:hypothetical protein ElyMa_001311100 [Elysia marginata]
MRDTTVVTERPCIGSIQIDPSHMKIKDNNRMTAGSEGQLISEEGNKVKFTDLPPGDGTDQPQLIPLPKIIVRDPVTHDTWEQGKYTTFQICVRVCCVF